MGLPRVHDDGPVRTITLDRPDHANALHLEDVDAIGAAVRDIGPDIRVVVLTGAGERAFGAGMHLDVFTGAEPGDGRAIISRLADCLRTVRTAPVPTIARLNGVCIGAAFELALACDLRVAHAGVRVGLPEVKLGIPSVVDAALLPHYLGASLAQELILTGDLYGLDELGADRLVNRLVGTPAELDDAVAALAATVAAPTREVVAAQKGLFETWRETGIGDSVTASVDVFAEVFAAPATRDALRAYRNP
ncbi:MULTISPECIES: enoyl-CoA hydratase/isomerase family protein [unclassified Pseudonocardia]|uniref:enoyl-CoA hydratase/isomerase family protein n=1 Tax=unclassified Pseudonocardia TaxID=2619320 RepID=UPI000681580A|nr:enoyl-CoA hydratase/isomerase family protein [Pseudonocardia sp. Ae707_Ps1]OLM19236.1 Enoyl-CoA hydratase [Pseudonocardia sp. Ae707_Ps1]